MKEYMMVFIAQDYQKIGLSPEETQNQMGKWFAWGDKMAAAGILVGGEALTPIGKSISGPNRIITDSPSAESKEIIGGYYTIKAASFDEAIKVAEDYPDFQFGGRVEIREIVKFD